MGSSFTTTHGKANVSMNEYAPVKRLRFNKEERGRIRQLKSTLKGESCCAALRKEELDEAILLIRTKGAPGPDDIHPQRSSEP